MKLPTKGAKISVEAAQNWSMVKGCGSKGKHEPLAQSRVDGNRPRGADRIFQARHRDRFGATARAAPSVSSRIRNDPPPREGGRTLGTYPEIFASNSVIRARVAARSGPKRAGSAAARRPAMS